MRRVDAWTHALAGLPGTGSRDVVADRDGRMKGRLLAWTPVAAGRPDTEAREVVAGHESMVVVAKELFEHDGRLASRLAHAVRGTEAS